MKTMQNCDTKFKILTISFLMLLGFFGLAGSSDGAILFQDDFESYSSDWACIDGELSNWESGLGVCGTDTTGSGFGALWRMGAGHNSSNGIYCYKKIGIANGYDCISVKWLTDQSNPAPSREIYTRWYMKLPPGFNKAIDPGCKLPRWTLQPYGAPGVAGEVYIDLLGATIATSELGFLVNNSTWIYPNVYTSSFNDGSWHAHEFHFKLNTIGQSNGIIEYWLDGTKLYSNLSVDFGAIESDKFYNYMIGLGNCSDSDWYQTEWTAISFDDYVVSTSYIGPVGGGDTTPPSAPQGLTVN